MKKYSLSFGQSLKYDHPHPERTAQKEMSVEQGHIVGKTMYQIWPNRASMAKTIRMQEQRAHKWDDWKAVVPLRDSEGY